MIKQGFQNIIVENLSGKKLSIINRNEYFYTFAATLRGRAVVARRAHNPEAVGSSPAPATKVFERKPCFFYMK